MKPGQMAGLAEERGSGIALSFLLLGELATEGHLVDWLMFKKETRMNELGMLHQSGPFQCLLVTMVTCRSVCWRDAPCGGPDRGSSIKGEVQVGTALKGSVCEGSERCGSFIQEGDDKVECVALRSKTRLHRLQRRNYLFDVT